MMTNSFNMPFVFLFHRSDEVRRSRIVATSEQEVLPHEDALSVTDLIEMIRFDNAASPDSDLSFY